MIGQRQFGLPMSRRHALALIGAASLAARPARADTHLAIWTGYPELQPWYQAVAAEYAKTHPGVSFEFFRYLPA